MTGSINAARTFPALLLGVALLFAPPAARAQQEVSGPREITETKPRMYVLSLRLQEDIVESIGREVENLMVTYLRETDRYEVMTQADVTAMLDVEAQKQLTGCDDDSCLAEIGGAVGAGWMVRSDLGKLGGQRRLTLKLVDTKRTRIDNQVSDALPEDDSDIAVAVRQSVYGLLRLQVPVEESAWYKKWWVWTIAGAVVAGAVVTGVVVAGGDSAPSGNLGQVTF